MGKSASVFFELPCVAKLLQTHMNDFRMIYAVTLQTLFLVELQGYKYISGLKNQEINYRLQTSLLELLYKSVYGSGEKGGMSVSQSVCS